MAPSPTTDDRRSWALTTAGLAALYLFGLGAIVVVALLVAGDGGGGRSVDSGSEATTLEIELSEFALTGDLWAPAGEVELKVTNTGTVQHDLTVEGTDVATKMLNPGETETISLGDMAEGEYTIICSVAGHKDAGMSATLMIGDMDGMDHSDSASGGDHGEDWAKMDEDMLATFAAFPAETEGVGNQLLPYTIGADGAKEFELTAQLADWEVEPGRTVEAWTYNGTVPSPMIKVDVGDTIRVTVKNELPVIQDVHWHGIKVPFAMDGVAPLTQEPIEPGGDFVYEFTVDRPYMGMYHPHLHGQMAVPNGMFGVIQVGETPIARGVTVNGIEIPADVQPAVDIPMVLNDAGVIGFSLDGKSFPATAPIVVNEGDWVAITYYNEGLQSHPMHLHEFPQLVTAIDGFPLESPYWADTVSVAPGQRYTVMFQADQKGTWVYHCHVLNHVERATGMFGMVTAVVVN
ncbi:MAG: multicopper oxidase domain-containing protein [Microthrixaceae bacterium]